MASRTINIYSPLSRPLRPSAFPAFPPAQSLAEHYHQSGRIILSRSRTFMCSAIEEPSTTTVVTEKKETEPTKTAKAVPKSKAAAKPKKAPEKPLPQLMEEEVIPALRATLEAEEGVSEIELSFSSNTLEGSFSKKGIAYIFWAFFPDGTLTGPKGFSLTSHGSEASTIEPFLIDERKITARHVVFWVEKRLAAQGILPVWKEE